MYLFLENEGIRIPAIIYGAHVSTTLVPILAEFWFSQKIFLTKILLTFVYCPFLILPFFMMLMMIAHPQIFLSTTVVSKKKQP